jgi:octaprenyl-diphosphate synthase
MPYSISSIQAPIDDSMKAFEGKFKSFMKTKVMLLDTIMHYIVQRKGKQMRPMFVF